MYQKKLEEACALLTSHFTAVENSKSPQPQPKEQTQSRVQHCVDTFVAALKEAGGTDDDALVQCTWEDIESFGAPKLLAKRIGKIFRSTATEPNGQTLDTFKSLKPSRVSVMSITELMTHYDPREATNAVGERINKIANGKKCIAFTAEGNVNIEASVTLLNELRDGYDERETIPVAGVPTKVYRIGERIGQLADENPLYPTRALRPNGDCDQTNRSWSGVSDVVRKVIYLARTQTGEIKITSLMDAHNIMDMVMGSDEFKIRLRLSKASLLYDELREKGNLPSLKISLKGNGTTSKQDPFGGHKTY